MTPRVASLLVHSQPLSAARTAKNILSCLGVDCVVIHVSPTADFAPDELAELVSGQDNIVINPTRCDLQWGRLIEGHLANFRLLLAMGVDASASVFLQASNDWYLRSAPGSDDPWGAHRRSALGSTSLWAHTPPAMATLTAWGESMGVPPLLSQCEGTWYPLAWAADVIEVALGTLREPHALPAEEYLLPTAASAQLPPGEGLPLIFSEVSRKDALVASSHASVLARLPRPADYWTLRSVHASVNRRPARWAISPADIHRVAATGRPPMRSTLVREGAAEWHAYSSVAGVKRVPIARDHPLRVLVEGLERC